MMQPSLDSLLSKVDSKYSLVVVAAKRARRLMEGGEKKVDSRSDKPVTIALEEIAADKVKFGRPNAGIK
ncbi:MAG: DNA-directed RNA polymerase subunit omega [Syntrophothermus sp.]